MEKRSFAFVDIETTGLDVAVHEIVEIGCVIVNPELEIIGTFEAKAKPEHIENADPVSLKVNHYSESGWENAGTLAEAMKSFSEKARDCVMVGHNVAFDSCFLEQAFAKTGVKNTMHYHKLDTISIAWAKLHGREDVKHLSLRDLTKHFGIENPKAHSALSDAYATFELYKKLMEV